MLADLVPQFRRKVEAVLSDLCGHGHRPRIQEGYRTRQQQERKIAEGTSLLKHWWQSKHCRGEAADIIDDGILYQVGHAGFKLFRKHLGSSAKAHGLGWGGLWRRYGKWGDWGHIELA